MKTQIDPFGEPVDASRVRRSILPNLLASGRSNVLLQLLQLGTFMLLSRLLAPEDFGILAMVMACIGLAELLQNRGLSNALVRVDRISRAQANTMFWISIGLGVILAVVVWLLAPSLAGWMGDPRIEAVARVLCISFLIGGLSAQHTALLRRSLRFVEISAMQVRAGLLTSLCTIVLALMGWGYWALVAGEILRKCLILLEASWLSAWRPARPSFDRSVTPMLTFGSQLVGFGLLSYCASHLQFILLGRHWGAAEVGYYNRASRIQNLPSGFIIEPLARIAPPTLARLQHDELAFARFYRQIIALLMLALVPASLWLLLTASDVTLLLLGPRWSGIELVVQALALGMIPGMLATTSGWLFLARGKGRAMLQWGLVGWPVVIACMVFGLRWGAPGVALMHSLSSFLVVLPCVAWSMAGTRLRLLDLWLALRLPLVAATVAAGVLQLTWPVIQSLDGVLWRVSLEAAAFGLAYVATLLLGLGGVKPGMQVMRALLAQVRSRS